MMRVLMSVLIFLSISLNSFSQKPKNGVYLLKYFDIEYNMFFGTCKLILNNDSVYVYAVKDCHRNPGDLIDKGILVKSKSDNWIISDGEDEEIPTKINFKKKIFYSF